MQSMRESWGRTRGRGGRGSCASIEYGVEHKGGGAGKIVDSSSRFESRVFSRSFVGSFVHLRVCILRGPVTRWRVRENILRAFGILRYLRYFCISVRGWD